MKLLSLVKDNECGAALVETALSFGVLSSLLIGVMMTSMLLFSYHFISEAAREGTRYAIVRGAKCTSWSTACPASQTDVQTYIQGLGYPIINSANITATTSWPDTSSPNCNTQSNSPGCRVQVQVKYPFTLSIPFVPTIPIVNMSSTSVMVISQ